MLYRYLIVLCLLTAGLLTSPEVRAQGKTKVIQFSGVVVGTDSVNGIPGVHIYVPKAGRGATSNMYGYFSMPVLVGDSVVVSAVGYQKQNFIIPYTEGDNFTAIVELREDTTYLPEVEIFPFPTEELFKEAILALELPDSEEYTYMKENLSEELMARMFRSMTMDGSMNHKWFMNQRTQHENMRYNPPTNPLLNPFAWAKFIQSIKRGDFKNKD